ncbi:hypothetical protein PACTADRAFT_47785 [Pachysolen tannophilus NRRL Y-2460]|uniref:Protein RCR2 n=1 Tax=Pachysolen tannophilus NRRL Y-2460 TaxID=669874 RepID=A0A1E4U1S2_PACTA|nr:hypothetical protein PACTADRAFT_47785 [Pachysolen tannophilus NRRL Y-2460]
MAPIITKRYWGWGDDSGDSSYDNARWAFFALFILAIIFLLIYTLRINKRRLKVGAKPIRGTSWITPPSYYASQRQYNQPMNSTAVPPYSATAAANDAGYYDNQGVFHPNPNFRPQQAPPKNVEALYGDGINGPGPAIVSDETGGNVNPHYVPPAVPQQTHDHTGATTNTTSNITGDDDIWHNFQRDFGRFYHHHVHFNGTNPDAAAENNNNNVNVNTSNNNTANYEMNTFERPSAPPPQQQSKDNNTLGTTTAGVSSEATEEGSSSLPSYKEVTNTDSSTTKN